MARPRTSLKANCPGKSDCPCKRAAARKATGRNVRANLAPGELKRTTYEGREWLVVPVIMARADRVMNGSIVPVEEFLPETWNGVPVTVGHPEADGSFQSANTPENLSDWSVGRIFNAHVEGVALKGEAWIDIERANEVMPDLIERLESGEQMDVSTGYFCQDEPSKGVMNGEAYEVISRALRPDHLALLPNEEGACNWDDGCGVRSNRKGLAMKVKTALDTIQRALSGKLVTNSKKPKANEGEGEGGDDREAAIQRLIASEESPFGEDDAAAMRALSDDAFGKVCEAFLPGDEKEPDAAEDAEEEPEGNEGEEGEEKPATAKKGNTMSKAATKPKAVAPAINAEDRAALEFARRAFREHKAVLVAKVVANSAITKDQAEAMDVATLEVIANGLKAPAPNYSARAVPVANGEQDDEAAAAMNSGGVVAAFRARKAAK